MRKDEFNNMSPAAVDDILNNPNSKSADLEIISLFSNDAFGDKRKKAAEHPNTPGNALEHLAKSDMRIIQEAVAKNPNTPGNALEYLAGHFSEWIRYEVALNPSTPLKVLISLWEVEKKQHLHEDVIYAIYNNVNTPSWLAAVIETCFPKAKG